MYGYVANDSVNWVDPSGNFAILLPAMPAIVEGIAFVGSAVGAGWGVNEIINFFSKPPKNAYDPNGPKAPGRPSAADGFTCPEGGDNWVPNPNGKGSGWQDDKGNVWIPTGPGSSAYGGPHWDVQTPGRGTRPGPYINIYPGGKRR